MSFNMFELHNHNLNPNDFGFSYDGETWTLLFQPPWELLQLSVEDEFAKAWRELTLGQNLPNNLKKAGEMFCDVLHLWRYTVNPCGLPLFFVRASRAYDTEIIEMALDHPYEFDKMKAYCIERGLDSMIEAYFSGVPVEDIICE